MLDLVTLDDVDFALLDSLHRDPQIGALETSRRVGVARALGADPAVLLMDEPFGAVDPITRQRLQDELINIQNELRKTIVCVTHDFDEAVKLGDWIAVFDEGAQIVADPNQPPPMDMIGWVSSSYLSDNCGGPIAMALVEGGFDRMGETLYVPMPDGVVEVEVRDTNFWNPDAESDNG